MWSGKQEVHTLTSQQTCGMYNSTIVLIWVLVDNLKVSSVSLYSGKACSRMKIMLTAEILVLFVFSHLVCSSECNASKNRMISEQWIEEAAKANSHAPIECISLLFDFTGWRKLRKSPVKIVCIRSEIWIRTPSNVNLPGAPPQYSECCQTKLWCVE
jgi:hypothetical protein